MMYDHVFIIFDGVKSWDNIICLAACPILFVAFFHLIDVILERVCATRTAREGALPHMFEQKLVEFPQIWDSQLEELLLWLLWWSRFNWLIRTIALSLRCGILSLAERSWAKIELMRYSWRWSWIDHLLGRPQMRRRWLFNCTVRVTELLFVIKQLGRCTIVVMRRMIRSRQRASRHGCDFRVKFDLWVVGMPCVVVGRLLTDQFKSVLRRL